MDYSRLQLFDMIHKKQLWLSQRQDVLAQNVANADTPDYNAKDLVPLDFKRTLAQQFHRLRPEEATQGKSMPGTLPLDPKWRSPEEDVVFEHAITGNNVVLEEQLANIQQTHLEHRTATNLYTKYIGMMKTALGRHGR